MPEMTEELTYLTCEDCGGSGLSIDMAGEPDECPTCKGNTVLKAELILSDELIIAALREGFIYHCPNNKSVVANNEATKRLMAYAADRLEALTAALQAAEAQPVDGWVMVPREPTKEMTRAAWDDLGDTYQRSTKNLADAYRSMLAVRPLAPTPSHSLAEADRLRALLVRCERTFDLLLEPETIGGSTVFSAFAKCTEMRAAIKSALSIAREAE